MGDLYFQNTTYIFISDPEIESPIIKSDSPFDNIIDDILSIIDTDNEIANIMKIDELFSTINTQINSNIMDISNYIKSSEYISKKLKETEKIKEIDIVLKAMFFGSKNETNELKPIENTHVYTMVNNIITIISRIKNENNRTTHGCILNDKIPKNWKLSDTNNELLSEFVDKSEFLLHNDIFIQSKNPYLGFNSYRDENKHVFFNELFNIIRPYTSLINIIKGFDDNETKLILSKENANIFCRFILITILKQILRYIEDLIDSRSKTSIDVNPIYASLEESNEDLLESMIITTSNLFFDIIRNITQEYFDNK